MDTTVNKNLLPISFFGTLFYYKQCIRHGVPLGLDARQTVNKRINCSIIFLKRVKKHNRKETEH